MRIPEEILSRRFDYGFKFSLMHKDVRIAENIVSERFPGATLLPTAKRTMDAASVWLEQTHAPSGERTPNGTAKSACEEVDYTRISAYLEHLAHTKLAN